MRQQYDTCNKNDVLIVSNIQLFKYNILHIVKLYMYVHERQPRIFARTSLLIYG